MNDARRSPRDPLTWAARNPVFANLVMVLLLAGGLLFATDVQQTVFPDIEPNEVIVTVPYPGAAPEEVERGVILAIEEEVRGVEGVLRIRATAAEDSGTVVAELFTGVDRDRARTDIDAAVAGIVTFPEDAETPVVQVPDPRVQVVSLIVAAPLAARDLFALGERFRDELLQDDRISLVETSGLRPPEISIEIPQANLRRYGLSLPEIARRVDAFSIDLPAGEVQGAAGDTLLRITEQRDRAAEFGTIPLVSLADGTEITVADIGAVREDFRTSDTEAFLDGTPAVRLDVFRVGDQTPMEVSAAVHDFVDRERQHLPPGVTLLTWDDSSEVYADRLGLLLRNGLIGLALVLVILGIFLRPQLAFWVTVGMAVAFLGAFAFMPLFDVSLNMISLFAFLLALGIVVDDAIVVGEAAYTHRSRGLAPLDAAIAGVHEMFTPVTFAVLTTIIAFVPMLFIPGIAGDFFRNIPLIVIPILLLSLFESFFVLPAHVGHGRVREPNRLGRLQQRFAARLETFVSERYAPFAARAVELRYLTLALALALLLVIGAMVASNRITFTFFPDIEGDIATATIEFPFGAPVADTRAAIARVVAAARTVDQEAGGVTRGTFAQLGSSGIEDPAGQAAFEEGPHAAFVQVALLGPDARTVTAGEFIARWREVTGEIAGTERLRFDADLGPPTGDAVAIELTHRNIDTLDQAARRLAQTLEGFGGVFDIDDGVELGKRQLDLTVTAAGRAAGLTAEDLGAQVRGAFFGAETERQQRDRHELRIFVRRPLADRNTAYSVETLLIALPDGGEMPLLEAARIEPGRSPTRIERTDARRIRTVTADVDLDVTSANEVIGALEAHVLPELMRESPGLGYRLAGEQQEQADALGALGRGMLLALLGMYALMAVAFRSYILPLVVMFAIPFGIVGAVIGHLIMGYDLSLISLLGLVALAGVVVNGSLVYIIAVNALRTQDMPVDEALREGGIRRFRPILLTSLTTFFGLAPMIFETSIQARFLIPMAISLGFGVLFVTVIVLLLVPAVYRIVEDGRDGMQRLRQREG